MSEFDEPECPWCAHSRLIFPDQHDPPTEGDAVTKCNLCNRTYGISQAALQRFSDDRQARAERRR